MKELDDLNIKKEWLRKLKYLKHLDDKEYENVIEIVKALKNCVQYQNILK